METISVQLSSLTPTSVLDSIGASFRAMPFVALVSALLLAIATHAIDRAAFAGPTTGTSFWLVAGDVDTVRTILTTAAAGFLGIVGVLFSVTVTTIALASQQYGPFVLRTFMQRRFVQATLALFVGIALFCVISLYFLGDQNALDYRPLATLLTVLVLILIALVQLVTFIHRTAESIQADAIIEEIHDDLMNRFDSLFPARKRAVTDDPTARSASRLVHAPRSAYLRRIVRERAVKLGKRHDIVIECLVESGEYVLSGAPVARVYGGRTGKTALGDEALFAVLAFGPSQTPEQDTRFALRQLGQITLRALSPALNDPQTAIGCLDRIASICERLLEIDDVPDRWPDDTGTVRLCERRSTPETLIDYAFDRIRLAGGTRPDIAEALAERLCSLAERHPQSRWTGALVRQLQGLGESLAMADLPPQANDAAQSAQHDAISRMTRALDDELLPTALAPSAGTSLARPLSTTRD